MIKRIPFWVLAGLMFAGSVRAADLAPVFHDATNQFTGVAVSRTGRLFVNYPRWGGAHRFDVVEVFPNGSIRPFPDPQWNSWHDGEPGSNKWVCVQSVYVDDEDKLWIVDPASPEMKGVYQNSQKLVKIDLKTDKVERVYNLSDVVGPKSYLNDVRVDTQHKTAYLTESQEGGIVVLFTGSGKAWEVLKKHKSVEADPNHRLTIDGEELMRDGKPMKANADGIALSPDREWLYFKPLSDMKLYRVRTTDLRNDQYRSGELEKKVEDLGSFTTSDGMTVDAKGNLYLSDIEHGAIVRIDQKMKLETVAQDKRLLWPDSFAWSPDGAWLYVSCSQIQTMPWSHNGKSTRTTPYTIYKFRVD
jgi:sugar lactone lactonase YvrE